jgi:hypothetical protein
MTDTERNKIIEKIKKLLTLAKDKGATEHEAALATVRAQEFLEKYNLDMIDVEVEEIITMPFEIGLNKSPLWLGMLIRGIMEEFGCQAFVTKKGRHTEQYMIFGTKVDIEVARYVLEYLRGVVMRMQREYASAKNFTPELQLEFETLKGWQYHAKQSYRLGLVETLLTKIHGMRGKRHEEEQKGKQEQTSASGLTGTEIMRIKQDKIAQKQQNEGWKTKESIKGKGVGIRGEDYTKGRVDGEKVQVRRGIKSDGSGGGTKGFLT